MKRSAVLLLVGVPVGAGMYLLLRKWPQTTRKKQVHLGSGDLQYQDLSPEDLLSQHLTDINEADSVQLKELGLDQQSLERLIENRPYRNKLELVSRMILTEDTYARLKEKIAVAKGREPVKVAS